MGIDIGTTGTKAIAFDSDGNILGSDYREYNLLFPKPGWVEFDTPAQWDTILGVLKSVNSNPAVKKDPVTALSVSTFGEDYLYLKLYVIRNYDKLKSYKNYTNYNNFQVFMQTELVPC
jgi:sugar (pentulose or hexulose) kinase